MYFYTKIIQKSIVDIVFCVQYNLNSRKPYDQIECRKGLYENLVELCFSKNTKLAPPISISISLFKNGLNDPSTEVI